VELSLKKLEIKHKIILFGAGIAAVIVVFYLYLWLPQTERIAALTAQYQTERQRVQTIEAFANAHPDIGAYETELNNKLAQVDKMLPNNAEISEFIIEAENIAKISGVQLLRIKPAPAVNKNGYREIPLEMVVKGNYFQTLSFLKKLEEITRFNSVLNLATQSKNGDLESKLSVVIYSYGVTQQNPAEQVKQQTAPNQK